MVTKGDRLCGLQMSKTGHNGVGFTRRQLNHAALQASQNWSNLINLVAQPELNIGGYLIVA